MEVAITIKEVLQCVKYGYWYFQTLRYVAVHPVTVT